ncbi:MAG: hypothetical protein RLY93_15895 [Sumerlaeia bacterium]
MIRKSFSHTKTLVAGLAAALLAGSAFAQFVSGSNGEDGELLVASNMTLPLQDDGVHEYTTITIEAGATLTISPNANNTPVFFLASGPIVVNGTINVAGANGLQPSNTAPSVPGNEADGGAGGYAGGLGALPVPLGGDGIATSGQGPGGGLASLSIGATIGRAGNGGSHRAAGGIGSGSEQPAAPTYGDPLLQTLRGGSGGAGSNYQATQEGTRSSGGGGGGGGAILLASSDSITIDGIVDARGGNGGGGVFSDGGGSSGAGGGAGGAIRVVADTVSGTGQLLASGGAAGAGTSIGGAGGNGWIRIETFAVSGTLPANSRPGPLSGAPNPVVRPGDANLPSFRIVSIGGIDVPEPASGSLAAPDVIFTPQTPSTVTIVIETENIPDGAIINLRIPLETGEVLTVSTPPVVNDGTSVDVMIPNGFGVIYGSAEFNPTR